MSGTEMRTERVVIPWRVVVVANELIGWGKTNARETPYGEVDRG